MQLNTLQPKHARTRPRPRVGRGGKRGTTSGKGTKGQKSRSGRRIRPAIREFVQRLPKLRGYANKSVVSKPAVLNMNDLKRLQGAEVTRASLIESGIVRGSVSVIKLLGVGEITRALTVKGIKVSASAKEKIEKAGGKVAL